MESCSSNQEKSLGKQFIEGFHLYLAIPLSIRHSCENIKANDFSISNISLTLYMFFDFDITSVEAARY